MLLLSGDSLHLQRGRALASWCQGQVSGIVAWESYSGLGLFVSSRGRWIVTRALLVTAPRDAREVRAVSAVCEGQVGALSEATSVLCHKSVGLLGPSHTDVEVRDSDVQNTL